MKKISIEQLREIFKIHNELLKIANALRRQDENLRRRHYLSPRQKKYIDKLEKRAEELANKLGYKSYFEHFPKGGTLHIVEKKLDLKRDYSFCYDFGACVS